MGAASGTRTGARTGARTGGGRGTRFLRQKLSSRLSALKMGHTSSNRDKMDDGNVPCDWTGWTKEQSSHNQTTKWRRTLQEGEIILKNCTFLQSCKLQVAAALLAPTRLLIWFARLCSISRHFPV
jgi:hypothetical protein